MFFRFFTVAILFHLATDRILAQQLITGRVYDLYTRDNIEGVDVTVFKGTAFTRTNKFGYFQLAAGPGDTLLLTHRDYKAGLINVPDATVFNVYLENAADYPVYLSGLGALYNYLQINLKYPGVARLKSKEGMVVVVLEIDPDGKIVDCKALNTIGGNCAREAVEVFREIPGEWSKGSSNRNLIFPVIFQLTMEQKEIENPKVDLVNGKIMDPIFVTPGY